MEGGWVLQGDKGKEDECYKGIDGRRMSVRRG